MSYQLDNKTKVRTLKKSLLYIWMLPLLIFSIAVVDVRAQQATIGVEPDSIFDPGLGPGSNFTVEIWIHQVEDLAGLEFKLAYNTTVLNATLITYGDIFGETYFPLTSEIHDDEGYVWYGFMEGFGEPGFNGTGRAAIINFTVASVGESVLHLNDTKLGDSSVPPVSIVHDALDGYFSNVEAVIESCDSAGDQKDTFDLGETVYVTGGGYSPSTTYNFSIVVDEETWTDGMAIPERVPETATTISSNIDGDIQPTAVWSDPQTVGKYDMVVDVNGNGQYDAGIDALDDNEIEVTGGFLVIPEFLSFIILPLFMTATLLAAIMLGKKTRKKKTI
jgi:hypothetical protein